MAMAFRDRIVETAAGGFMNGIISGLRLPAPNDGVDIKRVDLDAVTASADTFRRH
jgi:hypothetical protein